MFIFLGTREELSKVKLLSVMEMEQNLVAPAEGLNVDDSFDSCIQRMAVSC